MSVWGDNLTCPKTAPQASELMTAFVLGAQVRNPGIVLKLLTPQIQSISNPLRPTSEEDHLLRLSILTPQASQSDSPPSTLH